jgi:two-component system, OmpR family, phosphate regulon sensor histidine kinase PhoR
VSAGLWVLLAFIAGLSLSFVFAARGHRRVPVPRIRQEDDSSRGTRDDTFERVVGALPMGVLVLSRSLQIQYANSAAGAIFAFDAARAQGTHLLRAVPNVELERRVLEALSGEASVAPLLLPDHVMQRTYRVSVVPLNAEDAGVAVFADDQTELARSERASREFLSNVSHELRTPLSSVKLMLETVAGSHDDETRELFVPQALSEVDRLAMLVGRLLDQARTESGRLKLKLDDVDLEEVARQTVASFDPQAVRKGVGLQVHALRPVHVEADRDRLSQVLVNLVDNALRHTGEGGRVVVELDAQGNEAIMRVRDTGEGIPYRNLPHIFERFYVADRSRARESGGAGLGLAIVKGIVDAHDGSISAESTLGSGTAITIRLPIVRMRAP